MTREEIEKRIVSITQQLSIGLDLRGLDETLVEHRGLIELAGVLTIITSESKLQLRAKHFWETNSDIVFHSLNQLPLDEPHPNENAPFICILHILDGEIIGSLELSLKQYDKFVSIMPQASWIK